MLRLFALIPGLAASRAIADGSNGTLGAGSVGTHELRPGAVALDRLAPVAEGRVLGRAPGTGTGAPETLDGAALAEMLSPFQRVAGFEDRFAAEAASVGAQTAVLVTHGRDEPGDGGGAVWIRSGAEPSHAGKLRTADGAWWRLDLPEPSPAVFGARFDGATDDAEALNAWAGYLRATGRPGRLPHGVCYCASTLYFGGVTIRGAGGPSNSEAFTSKTVIRSAANPIVSMARSAADPQSFHLTHWEDFTVAGTGGATAPIELWDRAGYAFQVGFWLGRGHAHMQTAAGGETPAAGGAGNLTIRRVNVEDCSGWGIYGYKLWGKSLIDDCFLRRCGGHAAAALDDDTAGGAMSFASVSVDFQVSNVHSYNSGYDDPTENHRGTGLRLGALRSETDALGRLWEVGGNQKFDSVFLERHAIPLDIRATLSAMLDGLAISGPTAIGSSVRIGAEANPSNNCKVSFGKWKSFDLDEIRVTQASSVDLGAYMNQQASRGVALRYWTGFSWSPPDGGWDSLALYPGPVTLIPEGSLAGGPRPDWQFLPFARTSRDPATLWANRLPPFAAAPGGALTGWTASDDGSAVALDRHRLALSGGAEARFDVADLTPGTLVTIQLWFELPEGTDLAAVRFAMGDATGGETLRRPLRTGLSDGSPAWRAFNAVVPAGGTLRLSVAHDGPVAVVLRHPVLVPGAAEPLGRAFLSAWPTPEGVLPTP